MKDFDFIITTTVTFQFSNNEGYLKLKKLLKKAKADGLIEVSQ